MPLTLTSALVDTVGITDALARQSKRPRSLTDTTGVTDALAAQSKRPRSLTDTTGLTDILTTGGVRRLADVVGTAASVTLITGYFVQFDSWRPVAKPDNSLVLICRTPLGEHDTYTGLTHLALWTIIPDGTHERPAVLSPATNGYGWDSYSHPEWSPSGNDIIVAAETSTEYKLVILNATGFGT